MVLGSEGSFLGIGDGLACLFRHGRKKEGREEVKIVVCLGPLLAILYGRGKEWKQLLNNGVLSIFIWETKLASMFSCL